MEPGKVIAANLNELRAERGLTLGQLSQLSGISKAMLAEMEKGGSNPTVNTLLKIANGLNVPYTRLLEEPQREAMLVRRDEAVTQSEETRQYRIHCYFKTAPGRNFEVFLGELDGEYAYDSVGHPAGAQEYLYVISGQLQLRTDGGCYTLGKGDALMFASSIRHTYANLRKQTAQFLIINYYPQG